MADPLATKQGRNIAIAVLIVILIIILAFILYYYFISRGSNSSFLGSLFNDINLGI